MFVPRDMSERSFSFYRMLQGDCLKSPSFTGFRHSENIFVTILEDTQFVQQILRDILVMLRRRSSVFFFGSERNS